MYKILHFGRSCKAYLRLFENQAPKIKLCCEACGRSLHKHGRYYRSVTTKHHLYRLYCPECGKTVSLLPDFLVPWARFATWVREAAITRKLQGLSYRQARKTTTTPALRYSHSTMKRWWKRHIRTASSVPYGSQGSWSLRGSMEIFSGCIPQVQLRNLWILLFGSGNSCPSLETGVLCVVRD